jgi:ribosomal protein L18E
VVKEVAVRTAASRTAHRVKGINRKGTEINHKVIAIVHHKERERIAISRHKVKTATGRRKAIVISHKVTGTNLRVTESHNRAIVHPRAIETVHPREINPKVTNHL